MKIQEKLCYSKLLWLLTNKDFCDAVIDISFSKPNFEHEGMAGYIETDVEFVVNNIEKVARAYEAYSNIPIEVKTNFYHDLLRIRGVCG